MSSRRFATLFLLGLAIRIVTSPFWGTQDMEFWKAYATYIARDGLFTIYGAADDAIISRYQYGLSFKDVVRETQTVIHFTPHNYFRTEYTCPQPPLYVYPLAIVGWIYESIDPAMPNQRLFNALLNIFPVLASILIAGLLLRFGGRSTSLVYWLNPLVILNSPVQGYLDPLVALFTTASTLAIATKRLSLAYACLAAAVLTKPQGVLIAPVIVATGLIQHSFKDHVRAVGCAALVAFIAFAPFLVTHHALSVVQGVLTIEQKENALSINALNLWWLPQYALNAHAAMQDSVSLRDAMLGRYKGWERSRNPADLAPDLPKLSLVLFGVFTIANAMLLWRRRPLSSNRIIAATAAQVFGYYILRTGVHENHYFVLVPLLAAIALDSRQRWRQYIFISATFGVAGVLFFGIGRDWTRGVELLTITGTSFVTVIVALCLIGAFFHLWRTTIAVGNGGTYASTTIVSP